MSDIKRVAIFFSGQGGGAENLIQSSEIIGGYTIALLLCSNPVAQGIARLAPYNIPLRVVPWDKTKDPHVLSMQCFEACQEHLIDVVCLAGWIKQLVVPQNWIGKVLNIHPSLLPLFGGRGMYGLKVHEAVIQSGVNKTGCTVHLIDNELDRGKILDYSIVDVDDSDTAETLQKKVYNLELDLYPRVLKRFLLS